MFAVRWNQRKRTQPWADSQSDYLIAVLVEAGEENGTPSERTVSYLGSIRSDHMDLLLAVKEFWASAERNLSAVELPPAMREKVLSDLRKVVPSPDDERLGKTRNER